ncbi:ATP-dependent DNA helicase RecQ [Ferruginibacter yonginensis]|uniref:ATP-dependent DNA helicase RecQ n=1 Tax=Ferruginibacter yonginensis TaxID=1310416 RepID=A0ABV8QSG1_9BACT
MDATATLEKYWGYKTFRPLQADIIAAVLAQHDTLALLPTGGGKSICFQVPAMMIEGICLVVSPLIALIKDQVENLKKKGIGALAIYAGMHYNEVKQTLQNAAHGNYKFLYVSPERLETKLFLEYLPAIKPSLLVVDEAHCISQWGFDFRPSYMRIANLRNELPNVPVIALTASATTKVQDDICTNLLFQPSFKKFQQSFVRPNLSYSVFKPTAKEAKVVDILNKVKGAAIVYCKSRKQTTVVANLLKANNINADFYHAGLSNEQRNLKQQNWVNNITTVIVCTNAFGMGIDKPDVRVVVHYDVPDCLENYYQEAGRAGRDEKRAYAVLLYNAKEATDLISNIENRYPSPEKLKALYMAVMNHLQIAAGGGEGESHDFDIAVFAKNFKFNILEATYGLQALAQDGFFTLAESMFKQSTVVFTVSKNDLQAFEQLYPSLEPTIKGLLRSYEGVFDYPAQINETLLAKFLKLDVATVITHIRQLHQHGILQYKPAAEKPQIVLLKNRMYTDAFQIDVTAHLLRKKEALKRAVAMEQYVSNQTLCRSSIIAQYFGDTQATKCGICDNCINNTDATLPPDQFNEVCNKITIMLQQQPLPLQQLMKQLKPLRQRSVWLVIQYLITEEIIEQNNKNLLQIKK